MLVAERGPLVFVFNWSPFNDYEGIKVTSEAAIPLFGCWMGDGSSGRFPAATGGGGAADADAAAAAARPHTCTLYAARPHSPMQVPVPEPGKYRVVLDSDAFEFGGKGRVGHDVDHFTDVRLRRPSSAAAVCYTLGRGLRRCPGSCCLLHPGAWVGGGASAAVAAAVA